MRPMTIGAPLRRGLDAVRHLSDSTPPWDDILLGAKELVGGDSASFISLDSQNELVAMHQCHIPVAATTAYVDHYYASDIITPCARGVEEGSWLDTVELFPRQSLEKSSYYVDFMCRHRMRQMLTFVLEENTARHTALSIQRDIPTERARRHLESDPVRAFSLALHEGLQRRRSEAQQWLDVFDITFQALGEATCLASSRGTVLSQSPAARAQMLARAGISQRADRLWHPHPDVRSLLDAALVQAALPGGRVRLQVPGPQGGACMLDLVRADDRLGLGGEPLVLLRLQVTAAAREVASGSIAATFGLTGAELKVLTALVAGQSAARYAATQCLSIHTVRKQIAIVMEKMDCHRQVDLVRKALGEQ